MGPVYATLLKETERSYKTNRKMIMQKYESAHRDALNVVSACRAHVKLPVVRADWSRLDPSVDSFDEDNFQWSMHGSFN